jgi:GDSL-like Lipase/Acylhydrolase family
MRASPPIWRGSGLVSITAPSARIWVTCALPNVRRVSRPAICQWLVWEWVFFRRFRLGLQDHVELVGWSNASCPGETTASFLVPGAPSNGCENSPGSSVGYRTEYRLHVQYRGTQMQYALRYLATHRHTWLVTIDIGANDVFLCQETTADACASTAEFDAVLDEIQANLTTIYTLIRHVAHYHGLLVALTYYSVSYSDPAEVAGTEALDSVIASVTEKFGGKVADGFAAFEGPSAAFEGSPCAAGLLIKLPDGTCNIHPSPAGHLLLAQAIEDVI